MPTAPRSHRPAHAAIRQKRVEYRASASERGYDWDWQKVAQQRRQMDCDLCQRCKANGILKTTSLVDHIVPVWAAPEKRLDIENTQCLCTACNTAKGYEDRKRYGGGC